MNQLIHMGRIANGLLVAKAAETKSGNSMKMVFVKKHGLKKI